MVITLAVITATVVGVMVGVEFAVAVFVGPILRRLPVGSWIEASADGARVLGRVMPFWYIGSLLLVAWLAAATWGGTAGDAAVAAAALLVVSVVMSVTLLVPIANRSATGQPTSTRPTGASSNSAGTGCTTRGSRSSSLGSC